MTFLEIVKDHGWSPIRLGQLRLRSTSFMLCDTGFAMIIPNGDYDLMVSAAVDDKYTRGMWHFIRDTIMNRQRPIHTQYHRNYDILFKASQRYGGIALPDNIVLFK